MFKVGVDILVNDEMGILGILLWKGGSSDVQESEGR